MQFARLHPTHARGSLFPLPSLTAAAAAPPLSNSNLLLLLSSSLLLHTRHAHMRRSNPSTNLDADLGRRLPSSGPDASLTWSLQALLVRHETYVAEAERDRQRLDKQVSALEARLIELDDNNKRLVDDNAILSSKLDQKRVVVAQSDVQIHSLTTILEAAQQEIQNLSGLASRTEQLQARIVRFETDRSQLQDDLVRARNDEQAAHAKSKDAKKESDRLRDAVARLETMLAGEHKETSGDAARIERRCAVEREIEEREMRAKRLNGSRSGSGDKRGGEVVSSFVREILQDNAHLQLKMLELQDSLQTSNEEVDDLRAQLEEHNRYAPQLDTPPEDDEDAEDEVAAVADRKLSRKVSQELHVHHHYHGPKKSHSVSRTRSVGQRQRRKRQSVASSRGVPATRPPSPPIMAHSRAGSASSSIVAASPKQQSNRPRPISMLPMRLASSSEYSSKHSSRARSTVFEAAFEHDDVDEYSRPTSPGSEMPYYGADGAPKARHASGTSGNSGDSFFAALGILGEASSEADPLPDASLDHDEDSYALKDVTPRTVLREQRFKYDTGAFLSSSLPRAEPSLTTTPGRTHILHVNGPDPTSLHTIAEARTPNNRTNSATTTHEVQRTLRRTASHSSILSISGMDINAYAHSHGSARAATPPSLSLLQSCRMSPRPVLDRSTALARAPSATLLLSATMSRGGNPLMISNGTDFFTKTTQAEAKGYTPLTDTFGRLGSWFGRKNTVTQSPLPRIETVFASSVVPPTGSAVDRTALMECLVEEEVVVDAA